MQGFVGDFFRYCTLIADIHRMHVMVRDVEK